MSFRTTLSNLAKLSTTWGAYGLSATAELLVYSETVCAAPCTAAEGI